MDTLQIETDRRPEHQYNLSQLYPADHQCLVKAIGQLPGSG